MTTEGLCVGLFDDVSYALEDRLRAKLRDLTISWLRFKYSGRIIEEASVDDVLRSSAELGYRYTLILTHGDIASHAWKLGVIHAVEEWANENRFFVAGDIQSAAGEGWFGLSPRCLLVDLDRYREFSRPAFGAAQSSSVEVALATIDAEPTDAALPSVHPDSLEPSGNKGSRRPARAGWKLIDAALAKGLTVTRLPEAIEQTFQSIQPTGESEADEFALLLGEKIAERDLDPARLNAGQLKFFGGVQRQVKNCQRGIFVWNFEDYADVNQPPADFESPLSSLYTVAAGLKTNWILETHGFDENTRLVYFDYSSEALDFKRLLHEEWNGEDYPAFLRYLFDKIPSKRAFYQLWGGFSPEELSWEVVDDAWKQEIERWGGEDVIRDHWRRSQSLAVEYRLCNMLDGAAELLESMDERPNAVIWWSNVFFTFFSNWHFSIQEREAIYTDWIRKLVARAPDVFVYGNDTKNLPIAGVRARDYAPHYFESAANYLEPRAFAK